MKHPPAKRGLVVGTVVLALRVVWWALVVATPLAGVWVSSSLAAWDRGPRWLAVAAGLALFPGLPLAWEAWSSWRRRSARPRVLTLGDRLTLRTLAVNVVFLGALLGTHPRSAFAALATRGDWMLDGRDDPRAQSARRALFALAGRLQWLYDATREGNPFRDDALARRPPPRIDPTPAPSPSPAPAPSVTPSVTPSPSPAPDANAAAARWPSPATLHPAVASLPPEAETSVASVARYIAARETDPYRRVKALHDYVADRVAYDVESYRARRYPPQDAETVFRTRRAVCAGYARLMVALAQHTGDDVVYVVGDARAQAGSVEGESHAWNAVKLGGRWYLLDATWDAGGVNDQGFQKRYRTDYLFAPPEVFGLNHFPDDPNWQLRAAPLSRGDYLRLPMMSPAFYAQGLALVAPSRSQVDAAGTLDVTLRNPRGVHVMVKARPRDGGAEVTCDVAPGAVTNARCVLPAPAAYTVTVFTSPQRYGTYWSVGSVMVNNTP